MDKSIVDNDCKQLHHVADVHTSMGYYPDEAMQVALLLKAEEQELMAQANEQMIEECTEAGTPHSVVCEVASDVLPKPIASYSSIQEIANILGL